MFKLLKYLRPYAWQLLALLVFVFLMVAANLELPDFMARIVNTGIVNQDMPYIWKTGAAMLLLSLGGAASSVLVGYLASRISAGFSRDVRAEVFTKVESFSLAEFNTFSTASLITRSTNDIQQLQLVLGMLLRLALMAPLTGAWGIVKAYHTAPSMTWIMALAVGALLVVVGAVFTVAVPRFKKLQKLVDRLNLVTREILTGLRVIRAFNTEAKQEQKFDAANIDLTKVSLFVNRIMVILQPIMMLVMNATMLGIVWVGARVIDAGNLQIGSMLAFMQYAMQVIFSFLMISIIFIMVPRASVSAQRVAEVLDSEPSINDPTQPAQVHRGEGRVEFDHVTFTYPGADAPVLKDITFTAVPGQTTAFIGSTGSGKSTLVNLIPRFYDVTEGAIKIDGIDVRQMRQEDVFAKIGYVPQQGVLFSGSVESNIQYGRPDASSEDIQSAAKIAQADVFITQLEGGYTAPIAQGGTNISGGQKQRLSIARAVIRRPEIFIFDDSFSALDFATDARLRRALAGAIKQQTVLIVAQRISTILNADRIVVLDEGRIVGQGSHQELMQTCSVYREIAFSQLSEAELGQPAAKLTSSSEAI
jgi:ATP-binding cassette subfamily B protein